MSPDGTGRNAARRRAHAALHNMKTKPPVETMPRTVRDMLPGDSFTVSPVSEYDQQAAAFLTRYGITCTIKPAADKAPGWAKPGEDHGNRYRVTLAHPDRSPVRFDFWGSINDKNRGEHPTAYGVLACISCDINTPDTFRDFCADYGYDEDSRTAERTFKSCRKFADLLNGFFTNPEEIEALQEIQ